MRHTFYLVLSVLALSSAACSIDVRGEGSVAREEKRFTVTGDPDLSIRTFDGSITVKSWDRKEVLVEIERRGADTQAADALVVNAMQEGNRIVVDAPDPNIRRDGIHFGSWQSPSVNVTVTAPRRLTIEARSGDGSITADDLAGTIALNTGDGSIRATRIEGNIKAHTGDGSIQFIDVVGRLEADSGDGSVDVGGRLDALDVRTGDGSVRIDVRDGSTVKSDWSVGTGDGSISVRMPPALDAELDAYTSDGRVHADGISDAVRSGDEDDHGSLRGRLGKGGKVIRIRSGDGSINLSR